MTDDEVRLWQEVYLHAMKKSPDYAPGYFAVLATQAVRSFRECRQQLALETASQ